MTKLLSFTRTQERRRKGFFCLSWNEWEWGIYSSGGGNMNGRSFNEGWQRIMNLDLILAFGEIWCIKAVFGSCKSISGKYSIFRKCYFPERKIISCVWLSQNSFYGKLISVFGSFKHFYRKCFTCPIFHILPQP